VIAIGPVYEPILPYSTNKLRCGAGKSRWGKSPIRCLETIDEFGGEPVALPSKNKQFLV
jgi:hypothetical protein